jgi:hypothetical protein
MTYLPQRVKFLLFFVIFENFMSNNEIRGSFVVICGIIGKIRGINLDLRGMLAESRGIISLLRGFIAKVRGIGPPSHEILVTYKKPLPL